MNVKEKIFSDRKASFYIWAAAAILALGGVIYYAIQSNADSCFDIKYFIALLAGVILFCAGVFTRKDFFIMLTAAAFAAAFGFMLYDMLPSLSDVWNGVDFIGGNLTAYIIYTVITFIVTGITVYVCFVGTENKE